MRTVTTAVLVTAIVFTTIAAGGKASAQSVSLAWGWNGDGQLGDGTMVNHGTPVPIAWPTQVKNLASGFRHGLALRTDGTAYSWGLNDFGQLGDGTLANRLAPVKVKDITGVTAIAGGDYHSLALLSNGTVMGWGGNFYGQLGDGTTITRTTAVRTINLPVITSIACGPLHSLAIGPNGTVWSWGLNSDHQLGRAGSLSHPAPVTGLTDMISISAGYTHSLALRCDGTVWAWGRNSNGQLGDGTNSTQAGPVKVVGLDLITSITCGGFYSIACRLDGSIWAWGDNSSSQLGDGTGMDQNLPVQITTLSDVSVAAAGHNHALARKTDGTVWAWGANFYGQLGNNSGLSNSTPLQISSLTDISVIAAGQSHSFALTRTSTAMTLSPIAGPAGASVTVSAYLKKSGTSQGISGKTLVFKMDGAPAGTKTTLGSGLASLNITLPTTVGIHTLTAEFAGDTTCRPAMASTTATVTAAATNLIVINANGSVGQNLTLTAKLTRVVGGSNVPNQLIVFKVGGAVVGSEFTGSNGVAKLMNFQPLTTGTFTLTAEFAGFDYFSPTNSNSGTLTVTASNTKLTVPSITTKIGRTIPLVVTLIRTSDGSPLAGRFVVLKVGSVAVETAQTNAVGVAVVSYLVSAAGGTGNRTILATFAGEGNYNASFGTGNMSVNP